MSQQMVGRAIDKLMSDAEFRARFAFDRIEMIANLSDLGIALTPDEIDVFLQTDVRLWSWSLIAIRLRKH